MKIIIIVVNLTTFGSGRHLIFLCSESICVVTITTPKVLRTVVNISLCIFGDITNHFYSVWKIIMAVLRVFSIGSWGFLLDNTLIHLEGNKWVINSTLKKMNSDCHYMVVISVAKCSDCHYVLPQISVPHSDSHYSLFYSASLGGWKMSWLVMKGLSILTISNLNLKGVEQIMISLWGSWSRLMT